LTLSSVGPLRGTRRPRCTAARANGGDGFLHLSDPARRRRSVVGHRARVGLRVRDSDPHPISTNASHGHATWTLVREDADRFHGGTNVNGERSRPGSWRVCAGGTTTDTPRGGFDEHVRTLLRPTFMGRLRGSSFGLATCRFAAGIALPWPATKPGLQRTSRSARSGDGRLNPGAPSG